MVNNIKANGNLIKDMDLDSKYSVVEVLIKESIIKIKCMDKVNISGLKVKSMMVNGIII